MDDFYKFIEFIKQDFKSNESKIYIDFDDFIIARGIKDNNGKSLFNLTSDGKYMLFNREVYIIIEENEDNKCFSIETF